MLRAPFESLVKQSKREHILDTLKSITWSLIYDVYFLQKTLPVMVAVVEQLRGALGESGLLVLPCIAAHIIQVS